MGVSLREISPIKKISIEEVKNKKIAVDASNHLYQFLSVIRSSDGKPIRDSKNRIVSHLLGLFPRTVNLIKNNILVVYVFDGKTPNLKKDELKRRREYKKISKKKYELAKKNNEVDDMRKYGSRTSKLTSEMIIESKKLLELMGIPFVQAPSEADAQISHMVKKKDCHAASTQDYDPLLHGANRLVRGISGLLRKKPMAEMILLKDLLDNLQINQRELIFLAMMKGTDYNPDGVKGIGFKRGLKLIRENTVDEAFEKLKPDFDWSRILKLFQEMDVTENYSLKSGSADKNAIRKFLIDERDFSEKRVESALKEI